MVIWAITFILLCSFALMGVPLDFMGSYREPDGPSAYPALGEVRELYDGAIKEDINRNNNSDIHLTREPASPLDDDSNRLTPSNELREQELEEEESNAQPISDSGDPQYDGTFWSHLLTLDLWLFWLCFFSMWGTGTVLIFNATQLYKAKNWGKRDDANQNMNVALIGVGSAFGRITGGILDIWVARRRSRGQKSFYTPIFFPLSSILLAVGFMMFVFLPVRGLVLPFLIAPMGNGLGWGLGVVCVKILYSEDIGKHYNFMFSSGILATVGLNRLMFGMMFDRKADEAGTSPNCDSPSCVIPQLWILVACNVVSTISAVMLYWRFHRFANRRLAEINAARAAAAVAVNPQEESNAMEIELLEKADPLADEGHP